MRILFLISFFIFYFSTLTATLFAQKFSTPLEPQSPPKQTELGLLFGLGNNFQTGIYQPYCDECQFEDGNKLGFSAGLVFLRDFNKTFQWGASLTYNSRSTRSSYIVNEMVQILIDPKDPNKYEERPIPFRNIGEIDVGELSLQPFFQWSPVQFAFIRLGFGASIITNANFLHTKELLKFKDTLTTGEIVDITIDGDDPNQKVVEDREMPGINTFQMSLEPAIGFNFEISPQIYLSPLFQYSIPLTKLSNIQKDFNINKWRITIELRFAIKIREFKRI
ncbi:hypothetical protein ACFLSQ_09910 [Bacteroidota bacterium]